MKKPIESYIIPEWMSVKYPNLDLYVFLGVYATIIACTGIAIYLQLHRS